LTEYQELLSLQYKAMEVEKNISAVVYAYDGEVTRCKMMLS
jgi:hypothetical protein